MWYNLRGRGNGQETTMRNPILAIAIAFVVVAPCTALAGGKNKEKNIEVQSFSYGSNSSTPGTSFKTTKPVSSSTGPTNPPKPTQGGTHK
jgi:hypothetical protein